MAQQPETTTKRAELPMRLTRLRVKNFRSIADIDIPLSPLTVLVGPNGSGKSNVVDVLRFVRDVFARGLDQAVMDREGMGVIQRWGTKGEGITIGVTIEQTAIENQNDVNKKLAGPSRIQYDFTFGETDDNTIIVSKETVLINIESSVSMEIKYEFGDLEVEFGKLKWKKNGDLNDVTLVKHQNLLGPKKIFTDVQFSYFSQEVSDIWWQDYDTVGYGQSLHSIGISVSNAEMQLHNPLFYILNPSELRQPQQTLKETPFDEKGRNLAAVLQNLYRNGRANWQDLRFALRQTVTGFENIEVEKVGGYLAVKLIYRISGTQPRTSYLGQESDGTIRMLGLLAALYQDPSQRFISIEEPEVNIHPGALAVLAGVIDEASLRSQILATTHSPDMLDHLPVESFLVVEKVGDITHVGPLDGSQIASVRKRLFTPGELFRMEGLQRQVEPESAS